MGELKIKLPDELERIFRRLAMRIYGYQKGSMSEAAKDAIAGWTEINEDMKYGEDPIEAISGIMKHVKKSSVQLQHEAWNYIDEKYIKRKRKKK